MALKLETLTQWGTAILERAIARRQNSPFGPMVPVEASLFLLTAAALKEQAMSRKPYSLSKQLVVATALALGASGVALADDSSMNPFSGDSYKYFNGYNLGEPRQFKRPVFSNAPADPSWRQSHPNGLTDSELAALSSSGLSASASQLNPPVFASAPADTSWRQSHPNGLTDRELAALGSSTLSRWQLPNEWANTATASSDQANVAKNRSKRVMRNS